MKVHDVRWDKEKVSAFWDAYSSNEALEGTYFSTQVADQIIGDLGRHIPPKSRILELGCGSAVILRKLASRGFDCSGIDISQETVRKALEAAKADGLKLDIRQASIEKLPFGNASFDAVVAFEVFEHLLDGELKASLAEILRVLRPGGRLVITNPYSEDLAGRMVVCPDCGARFHPIQHVRSFNEQSMRALLESSGFTGVRVEKIDFLPVGMKLPMKGLLRSLKKTAKSVLGKGSFTMLTAAEKPK